MLYIQAVGYMWCAIVAAFLFWFLLEPVFEHRNSPRFCKTLLVFSLALVPLLFMTFHFATMAAYILFW